MSAFLPKAAYLGDTSDVAKVPEAEIAGRQNHGGRSMLAIPCEWCRQNALPKRRCPRLSSNNVRAPRIPSSTYLLSDLQSRNLA
jgi:hypothetical protein